MNHRLVEAVALTTLLAAVACAVQGLWLAWDLREIARMLGGTPDLTEPRQWLIGAVGLLLLALGLGLWQQRLRRQADGPLPAMDLRALGTPPATMADLVRLALTAYGPLLLLLPALGALKALLVFGRQVLGPWALLAAAVVALGLITVGLMPWLVRRLVRQSTDPAFEPLYNLQGLQRLRRSRLLPRLLGPDEPVLESFVMSGRRLHWLVLTPRRLLSLRRTWNGDGLEREWPLAELQQPPQAPSPAGLPGVLRARLQQAYAPYQLKHRLQLHSGGGPALDGVLASATVRDRVLRRLDAAGR